jgi:hypothetical protein
VLNCSNVKPIVVDPVAALNKKRARSGKTPFFSYHVLQIDADRAQNGGGGQGGGHASPRLHLRRGHIRALPDGKRTTFVRAHLVGDANKGHVKKDYVIAKPAN